MDKNRRLTIWLPVIIAASIALRNFYRGTIIFLLHNMASAVCSPAGIK